MKGKSGLFYPAGLDKDRAAATGAARFGYRLVPRWSRHRLITDEYAGSGGGIVI